MAETGRNPENSHSPTEPAKPNPYQRIQRGGPKKTEAEKQATKAARKSKNAFKLEQRKKLLEEMRADGSISAPEFTKLARNIGIKIDKVSESDPPKDPPPEMEGTRDDPNLTSYPPTTTRTYRHGRLTKQGSRGFAGTNLDVNEQSDFINLIKTGIGRHAAAQGMGIDVRRVVRTLKEEPDFLSAVTTAEMALEGICMATILDVVTNQELDWALRANMAGKFVGIKSSSRQLIFGNKLASSEHRMKRKALEASIGALESGNNRPDFTLFSNDEFTDYTVLYDKLQDGKDLTDEEALRYGRYSAKLARRSPVASVASQVVKSIANTVSSPSAAATPQTVIDATFTSDSPEEGNS